MTAEQNKHKVVSDDQIEMIKAIMINRKVAEGTELHEFWLMTDMHMREILERIFVLGFAGLVAEYEQKEKND